MDASVAAAIVSAGGGVTTLAGVMFQTVRSGKDKEHKKADRTVTERTAEKIEAEKEEITERTRATVRDDIRKELTAELERVRAELEATLKKLEDADARAEKYREALMEKNDQIYMQDLEIRRLSRRAWALEDWIEANQEQFQRLGIEGLPADILDDRRHREARTDP